MRHNAFAAPCRTELYTRYRILARYEPRKLRERRNNAKGNNPGSKTSEDNRKRYVKRQRTNISEDLLLLVSDQKILRSDSQMNLLSIRHQGKIANAFKPHVERDEMN